MLPVQLAVEDGESFRLFYRRRVAGEGEGAYLELTKLSTGEVLWSHRFSASEDAMEAWTTGIEIPDGTIAARVFAAMEIRRIAERLPVLDGRHEHA